MAVLPPDAHRLQQHLDAWAIQHIDLIAQCDVAALQATPAPAGHHGPCVQVVLGDRTKAVFPAPSTDPQEADAQLAAWVRRTYDLQGLAGAFEGVEVATLTPDAFAARVEAFLAANPAVHRQRLLRRLEADLSALVHQTAGLLDDVGAQWTALRGGREDHELIGYLLVDADRTALLTIAVLVPTDLGTFQATRGAYQAALQIFAQQHPPLRAQLLAVPPPGRRLTLQGVLPLVAAMAATIRAYFSDGSAQADTAPEAS